MFIYEMDKNITYCEKFGLNISTTKQLQRNT